MGSGLTVSHSNQDPVKELEWQKEEDNDDDVPAVPMRTADSYIIVAASSEVGNGQ